MYSTSAMFKYLMAEPSRTLTARGTITYPDAATQALTAEEIASIQITEDAGAHLPLGGVSASSLTLTLDNREGEWNTGGSILGSHSLDGAVINLEVGVLNPDYQSGIVDGGAPDETFTSSYDGGTPDEVFTATLDGGDPDTFVEYYWSNIGTYIIEEPTAQEQQTVITLKGADILANAALMAFTDGQSYPRTVLQILQYACTQAGITLKTTSFTNSTESIATKPVWEPGTTCRDIIGYVACLAAGFARINRDGELEIIALARNAAGDIDDLLSSYFTYTDGILVFNSTDTILTLAADGADLTADPDNIVEAVGHDLVVTAFYDGDRYYVYPTRYKTLTRQATFGPFNALSVYEYAAPNGTGATRIAGDLGIVDTELNSVAVQGNPLLAYNLCATLMANMLSSLAALTYNGGTIDWQGDPTITTGDFVDVYDLNDDEIPLLVLSQTLTFGPGFGMSSGNQINTAVKGKAKTEHLRVFTPTGRLNAAALDGDINIRAGNQLNLLSDGKIKVRSGSDIDVESGGDINLESGADINVASGGNIEIASGGDIHVVSGGDIEIESGADINIASGGKVNIASGGDIEIASGGDINVASGGSMNIASGGDLTIAGGTVDIDTDAFAINNAAGEALLAVSAASGGDPGGQMVLGSESMPIRIGGNFVLPIENGGTGQSFQTNKTHYFATYPDNAVGIDGDLGVMANIASGAYAAITFTHYTTVSGNAAFCGLTRNWNAISPAGWTSAGNANATGTSNLYASAWSFTFTDPDTMDRIQIDFDSAKLLSGTWYGWNVSSYITIAVCSSAGAVLGSTTFLPSSTETLNSVNIECALEDDTTYYLIMYDNTTSATKSKCVAEIASVTSPAYAPTTYNCGLFVRHGGTWTLLASGSG